MLCIAETLCPPNLAQKLSDQLNSMRKQKHDELGSVFLIKMESWVYLHNIIGEIESLIEMERFNGKHPAGNDSSGNVKMKLTPNLNGK